MAPTDATARRGWIATILAWILAAAWGALRAVLLLWTVLAVYFSNLPWGWARAIAALTVLGFGIWALWVARRGRARRAFAVLFLAVVGWFVSIEPSHDRNWRPDVAVMPRAVIDGDRVRISGVRHFEYRSRDDFTIRYDEREVSLSHLVAVDFFISFWLPIPMGHTFVSFVFDNAPPISISIEARPEVGEGFEPLSSMFKQFELIYVVGDERDIVGVRTDHRDEQVFLYRVLTSPENARQLFLVYLQRINELADQAEFYHLLSNNCTINIVRYANAAGREGGFDWRHLVNGLIDGYLYDTGRIDTSLPFEELRARSDITAASQAAAGTPDFSDRIRMGLPAMPPQPGAP